MKCAECQELVELYVMGGLEVADEKAVRGHLAGGCPACAGALAEAEAVVHALPRTLKVVEAPEGAWEKIESRVALKEQLEGEGPEVDREALSRPFEKRRINWAGLTGWAAAAVAVIVLGLPAKQMWDRLSEKDREIGALATKVTDVEGKVGTLQVKNAELTKQMQTMTEGHQALLVSNEKMKNEMQERIDRLMMAEQYAVSGKEMAQPEVEGKVFVDKAGGSVTMCAMKVKGAAAGKAYELWLVPAKGDPMPAGMGKPDEKGMLLMDAKLPADVAIAAVAVTEEVDGPLAMKPTMPIQFLGKVE
jgi:anti-sigma-K factor RskA